MRRFQLPDQLLNLRNDTPLIGTSIKPVYPFGSDLLRKVSGNDLQREMNGNDLPRETSGSDLQREMSANVRLSELWNVNVHPNDIVLNLKKASGIGRKKSDLLSESGGKNLQIAIQKTLIEDVVIDPLSVIEGSAPQNVNRVVSRLNLKTEMGDPIDVEDVRSQRNGVAVKSLRRGGVDVRKRNPRSEVDERNRRSEVVEIEILTVGEESAILSVEKEENGEAGIDLKNEIDETENEDAGNVIEAKKSLTHLQRLLAPLHLTLRKLNEEFRSRE